MHCDDPVSASPAGWYRCRSCGYELLRSLPALSVAAAVYVHRCQFDLSEEATDDDLRRVAAECIRQGDLFADECARART